MMKEFTNMRSSWSILHPALPPRGWALAFAVFTAMVLLGGCQSLSGVPRASVKAPTISSSPAEFSLPSECAGASTLGYAYDKQQRNAWIDSTLACIADNYNAFVAELKKSEVGRGVATGILNLIFGISSSLTPSAGVKANYAAASLLVTGSNDVINEKALAEQTVSALISAMNANRAKAMVPIVSGMSSEVHQYPVALALEHLYALQRAGSLLEGLQFVTANAREAEQSSLRDMSNIPLNVALDAESVARRGCLTAVLQGLPQSDQSKLFSAYMAIIPTAKNADTVAELVADISIMHRFESNTAFDSRLMAELRKQGVSVPCGGS